MVWGVEDMRPWGEGVAGHAFLILLVLLLDLVSPHHYKNQCHSSYYHWPVCIDHPDGYGCECGPGFYWNMHMCVALGIDSRLEFSSVKPIQFTLLKSKPFPELKAFTIGLWLKVYRPSKPGTVLSYRQGGNSNLLRIDSGPTLSFKIHDAEVNTNHRLNRSTWLHLALTWGSEDGRWHLYINAGAAYHLNARARKAQRVIPGGGELVLGQASRSPQKQEQPFDPRQAFYGEMGFVNIWHHKMTQGDLQELVADCTSMKCGDAVEWADFRSGTRGLVRLRWPSFIMGAQPCFTEQEAGLTCDKYCSHVIGAQCNAEIVENVEWARTPADETARVPCPGRKFGKEEPIVYATRGCTRTTENEGMWENPFMDDCVSQKELEMKKTITEFVVKDEVNASEVLELATDLMNQTATGQYWNPVDISYVIDSVSALLEAQGKAINDISSSNRSGVPQRFIRRQQLYPLLEEIQKFAKILGTVLDQLVTDRNNAGWGATKPPGMEGDALIGALEELLYFLFQSLQKNVVSGALPPEEAQVSSLRGRLAFRTRLFRSADFPGMQFPEEEEPPFRIRSGRRKSSLYISKDVLSDLNYTVLPDIIGISTALYSAAKTLPNHDISRNSKEDNINSPIVSIIFHFEDELQEYPEIRNLSHPFVIRLPYVNEKQTTILSHPSYPNCSSLQTFNISNPECVRLVHSNTSSTRVYAKEPETLLSSFREQALAYINRKAKAEEKGLNGHDVTWHWTRDGCQYVRGTSSYAVCHCYRSGVFAVTTDMFDVNWDKGEEPNILMEVPSYIGCALSALLCLTTCVMLTYLRTSSKTAAIHKNFAVAIICSQVTFMSGIDKFEFVVMCHVFAIMFHYFFLATFSWLMNEAFNLYIVITYAAHAHGEHHESSSQWRYYILGWILPGVLVAAFVGTHTDDYYAPDMCWIAWQYIWLFLGPAVGIISVTVLVLIFTAKEHHESSYSKNEQTNKMILIHSKALWTQTILLTVCWSFAFLTLKMRGIIIKYLYALFNILQGAFFLVFYFLLNDEVRAVLKARQKRKNLAKHGYDYEHTPSIDSNASVNEMVETEIQGEASGPSSPSPGSGTCSNKQKKKNGVTNRKKKQKSQIEASSDEGSDCEIMITSV